MSLRILPIANPVTGQSATDNVLSEEVLTTLRKSLSDSSSYLLSVSDNGDGGNYFSCVISGYYIEGEVDFTLDIPSDATSIVVCLSRDGNNQVNGINISKTVPDTRRDYLELYQRATTKDAWIVKQDAYHRILPRALDLSQTLVLRCGMPQL